VILKNVKKVINYIINVLTILLVIILLLVIFNKISLAFSKNKYPNYFGYTLLEVTSGSMQPTLNIQDILLVKITKDNLKVDDIIAFQQGKDIITHRIIYIDNDTITVKGDSNNVSDTPISINQVIGKVTKVYPNMGVWKKVLLDPKVLIGIFITLILFDFALSYNPKDKKDKKKEENKDKEEEIVIKKIEPSNAQKLLEVTQQIDIEDINKMIEGTPLELSKKEIKNVKEEINNIKNDNKIDDSNLNKKEKEFLDYTIRLDLDEIQKRINKKVR
jgi:signal peptidase